MSIALLARRFDPGGGGTERDLIVTARFLKSAGHDVTIYVAEARGAQSEFDVHCVSPSRLGRAARLARFAYLAPVLARHSGADLVLSFARAVDADILRLGGGLHLSYLEAARGWRGAWSWRAMRWSPYHRVQLMIEKRGLRSPSLQLCLAVSQMVSNDIERRFGLDRPQCATVYNGVDLQRFRPADNCAVREAVRREIAVADSASLVLFAGNGFARKGLRFLLEAWPHAPANATLVVAGGDRLIYRYRQRARSLGIDARVRFLGPRADIDLLMRAADALVLPSLFEPFGNVVLEAMACALPVLTTAACGVSEILPDELKTFVIGDPSDTDLLGSRVRALLEAAPELGGAARAAAEAFTWENYGEKLRAIVESAIP